MSNNSSLIVINDRASGLRNDIKMYVVPNTIITDDDLKLLQTLHNTDIDEDDNNEYKQILPLLTCDEKVLFEFESMGQTKLEKYFKWSKYLLELNENFQNFIITNIFTINIVYYDWGR